MCDGPKFQTHAHIKTSLTHENKINQNSEHNLTWKEDHNENSWNINTNGCYKLYQKSLSYFPKSTKQITPTQMKVKAT